ncbi:MAG: ATP-binding cassette domain-containing protein [Trueperaceae bacterium]
MSRSPGLPRARATGAPPAPADPRPTDQDAPAAVRLEGAGVDGRLAPLDLSVGPGVLALLGANGAGKSTLLALMAGRLVPTRGRVWVAGAPARSPAAALARADVPQAVAFPGRARVDELLGVARACRGVGDEAVTDAIARMGLAPLLARRASRLSGGERQRLALASALMGAPRVWFLDEPAASLDREGLARLAAWVRAHAAAGGTVVVGAHRDEEVAAYAPRRLLRLEAGAVVGDEASPPADGAAGPPADGASSPPADGAAGPPAGAGSVD